MNTSPVSCAGLKNGLAGTARDRRCRAGIEAAQTIEAPRPRHVELVAQTDIDREVLRDLPVVLDTTPNTSSPTLATVVADLAEARECPEHRREREARVDVTLGSRCVHRALLKPHTARPGRTAAVEHELPVVHAELDV